MSYTYLQAQGGGILGGKLLGHTTVCAVEINAYCRRVLLQRQRDGILPIFPIWDDISTFDAKPWRGRVDIVCGGFPCQDISSAGRGDGINGSKSKLWNEMARVIGEVEPRFVFVENSPMLTSRGLGRVLGDLASMGFNAKWGVLGAVHAGAPHKRERIWILANSNLPQRKGTRQSSGIKEKNSNFVSRCAWWGSDPSEAPESRVGRMAHGVAFRVDRLKAIGNGQVPAVAAKAWELLIQNNV